jgi:drug/metabolite transporter (DMT)-like permease
VSAATPGDGHIAARDVALLIAITIIWGLTWPIIKVGLRHVGPLWLVALRFIVGAACLFAVLIARGRLRLPPRADLPVVLSVGFLQMALFNDLTAYALTHVGAGRSAVLAYTTPLWVTPAAALLLGEHITPRRLLGAVLGLAGVAVMFDPAAVNWSDREALAGNGMLLLAAMAWAVCIVHVRGHRWRASPLELAPWQLTLSMLVTVPAALLLEGPVNADGSLAFWVVIAYVGVLSTGFGFWAVLSVGTRLPATVMSVAVLGVPVTGMLVSSALLGERLTLPLLLGLVAVLGGIALTVIPRRRRA